MQDSRPVYTLQELAEITGSKLIGSPSFRIFGIETIENAREEEVTFLANRFYLKHLKSTKAGAVFISPSIPLPEGQNCLLNENPSLAFQQVVDLFFPPQQSGGFEGIHPTAVVHEKVKIGLKVQVGPRAVIDSEALIGTGTVIGAGVFIGSGTVIGEECIIHPNVTIREGCSIGNRVVIQPGAVIGSCGFGYVTDEQGRHTPLRQVGGVIIEDDVEIGANTTIDRGRFKSTRIGRGTKIDNLVQIAHQVELGEDNIVVSQVGIAGSTKTGKNVILAGQVGVIGHLTIADRVIVAAGAKVIKSITIPGGIYSGAPCMPIREFNELMVYFRNLPKHIKRLQEVEKNLQQFTAQEAKSEPTCSPNN